jgi:hypothetical protein
MYREFYIRGEGPEKLRGSDRNRPRFALSEPLQLQKFVVKTAEVPLAFSPLVYDRRYHFTVVYTHSSGGTMTVNDSISFTQYETFSGLTLIAKIAARLLLHSSIGDTAALIAANDAYRQASFVAPWTGTFEIGSNTLIVETGDTNKPPGSFTLGQIEAMVEGGGTITDVSIDFGFQSILADLIDYPYHSPAVVSANIPSEEGIIVSGDTPIIRSRPSYLLLHSNLRAGLDHPSTGKPSEISSTVIAKLTLRMDDTQGATDAAQVWVNSMTHPDLMFTANNTEYSHLEFWMTYPDGVTPVHFSGNSFSLTLATIASRKHGRY